LANLKQLARGIFDHALEDCGIEPAFDRRLRVALDHQGARLILDDQEVIPLHRLQRVRILAAGKAAAAMLDALLSRLPLPSSCDLQGVLIAPGPPRNLPATIQFFPGGHPVPDQVSFAGASAALSMLRQLGDVSTHKSEARDEDEDKDTLCIFLISGGASAMMELPLDASISLDDTIAFHRALVAGGASIVEMNCVRKHFSAVKGGRLALAAGSAQKLSLLVSDVPPAHLDALASGPTVPDPTTVAQCREILARYNLLEQFPPSVRRFFTSPHLPETPKPGELISPGWKLLDSDELANAAFHHAASLGFHAVIDNTCDDWSCAAAADYLLARLRQLRRDHPRVCLISCGEVSVKLPEALAASAIGGRNQHFVLYAATQLRAGDAPIAVLSTGSDGIDGNSRAAGAVIDEHTIDGPAHRANAQRALESFDSSSWLSAVGASIVTGPTGHNLRDLRLLLADASS
jgi:glycerate 2-kinase